MVLGIGHDLVHVPRIARMLEEWTESFRARVFTAAELEYCARFADPAPHFAARFAAKEAFYKALSRGRPLRLAFTDVGVALEGAAPVLELAHRARRLAREAGVTAAHLTLCHEKEYASAFVVLEGTTSAKSPTPGRAAATATSPRRRRRAGRRKGRA